jgi:hypothetical protein
MKDVIARVLSWIALALSSFGLVSIAFGHIEWTAWMEGPAMSLPSAICIAALALARVVKDMEQ